MQKKINFINSFKNEFFINSAIDAGKAGSIYEKTDMKYDASATGVYKAFQNADIICKEIMEKK